jgi:hypothetical protein
MWLTQPCFNIQQGVIDREECEFHYVLLRMNNTNSVLQRETLRLAQKQSTLRLQVRRDAHGFVMYSLLHYSCSPRFGCYLHPSPGVQTAEYSRRYV